MLKSLKTLLVPSTPAPNTATMDADMAESAKLTAQAVNAISTVVLGKTHQIKLAIACLLAQGHLLIEDVPGVGKTTLAHALTQALNLNFSRVQFTSDLLPGDVLGSGIYDRATESFRFHQGPIFTHLLLADEINRSSPKAQSALLEAMEERQVSIDGVTHALPEPFFVVATQNPAYQLGTFPLPESQLDRFLMCLSLGYPDEASEKAMMKSDNPRRGANAIESVFSHEQLMDAIAHVRRVHVSDPVIDYIYRIVQETRSSQAFVEGLSPRPMLGLLHLAKAWALMHHRDSVHPDDVQIVFPHVATHRLQLQGDNGHGRKPAVFYTQWLTKIPSEI